MSSSAQPKFSADEWKKIRATLKEKPARYGLPQRVYGSVVVASDYLTFFGDKTGAVAVPVDIHEGGRTAVADVDAVEGVCRAGLGGKGRVTRDSDGFEVQHTEVIDGNLTGYRVNCKCVTDIATDDGVGDAVAAIGVSTDHSAHRSAVG